jgi:hypothetical protein
MLYRLDRDLSTFVNGSYLGSAIDDWGLSLAAEVAADGKTRAIYLGGATNSPTFPNASLGAQPDLEGLLDGFVSRWTPDLTH